MLNYLSSFSNLVNKFAAELATASEVLGCLGTNCHRKKKNEKSSLRKNL